MSFTNRQSEPDRRGFAPSGGEPSPLDHPDWDDPIGLVATGGDLRPQTLLHAYSIGVFPWYDETLPICWWSPDPRAIIEIDGLRPSRRLLRVCRGRKFQITVNRAFREVMEECGREREEGTWIIPEMVDAYVRLHQLGHAHSVEVWHAGALVGGVYGVAMGGFFAGESMFHRVSDASKVALVHLFARLRERGFVLFDTQFLTPITTQLGGIEIPRKEYLARLRQAIRRQVWFDDAPEPDRRSYEKEEMQ